MPHMALLGESTEPAQAQGGAINHDSRMLESTVKIRGNVRGETGGARLEARRSLSIALVRPASVLPFGAVNALLEIPPIGLAYLAASLTKAGHRVRIID